MNKLICQHIFLLLSKYGKVSKDEKDIYLYGIEIVLEKAENLIFISVVICIYRRWMEGIFFVVIYSMLRKAGGGYHAKTSKGCILFTIAIINIFCQMLYTTLFKVEMGVIMMLSACCIYAIAPVDCYNNPLIGKYKKKNLLISLIMIICLYWIMTVANQNLAKAIFYIVNIYLIVLILGIKDSPRYKSRRKND